MNNENNLIQNQEGVTLHPVLSLTGIVVALHAVTNQFEKEWSIYQKADDSTRSAAFEKGELHKQAMRTLKVKHEIDAAWNKYM
tara:strand:- start:352 stop:600 length:249 start_codon:yes stop_codon:yes gene_type:complete